MQEPGTGSQDELSGARGGGEPARIGAAAMAAQADGAAYDTEEHVALVRELERVSKVGFEKAALSLLATTKGQPKSVLRSLVPAVGLGL